MPTWKNTKAVGDALREFFHFEPKPYQVVMIAEWIEQQPLPLSEIIRPEPEPDTVPE